MRADVEQLKRAVFESEKVLRVFGPSSCFKAATPCSSSVQKANAARNDNSKAFDLHTLKFDRVGIS